MIFKKHSKSLRAAIATVLATGFAHAQTVSAQSAQDELHDESINEIIVTTSLQKTAAETALPVNILSGELLRERAAATLGETLSELIGINSASFGAGVGLPVIRGQTGNRVQVLQGGISNIDASAVSPDHANSLEAGLAERIEVLRGPSTLLYGNGTIGGVVNVIDNRIPQSVPDALTGLLETRHNTVSDQQMSVLKLDGGAGQFAWHVDGIYRVSNDTDIRGYATNPDTIDLMDPEELEELLATRNTLPNSASRANSATLGASWIFDRGYLGVSINRLDNNYGLPAASHAHHDDHDGDHDDHDDDHDEDHDDDHDDHDDDNDEHGEEGGIRIAMKQQRVDFAGQLRFDSFFQNAQGRLSFVDYEHAEIEGDGAVGTVYANKGHEGRFTVAHRPIGAMNGVFGLQFGDKEFSAQGEEAYLPQTDIASLGLFTVQSINRGAVTYEFGLRAERQKYTQSGGRCDQSETGVSASASTLWRYREDSSLIAAVSHSQRAASVEELYSNIDPATCAAPADDHDLVAHFATNRFEIGNLDADKEKSTNLDLAWRRDMGSITAEVNLFHNSIANYIYLQDTGVFEDDIEIARISQEDAVFRGIEAQILMPIFSHDNRTTNLTLFGDYVRARFDQGGNVPRIPAARIGAEVSHAHADWVYKVRATHVGEQTHLARNETKTASYTLLGVVVDYHTVFAGQDLTFFAKGNNLLNEQIRHHASQLKDVAPGAGRGFELGMRLDF